MQNAESQLTAAMASQSVREVSLKGQLEAANQNIQKVSAMYIQAQNSLVKQAQEHQDVISKLEAEAEAAAGAMRQELQDKIQNLCLQHQDEIVGARNRAERDGAAMRTELVSISIYIHIYILVHIFMLLALEHKCHFSI